MQRLTPSRLISTKRPCILNKQACSWNLQTVGLFWYVWPIVRHQELNGQCEHLFLTSFGDYSKFKLMRWYRQLGCLTGKNDIDCKGISSQVALLHEIVLNIFSNYISNRIRLFRTLLKIFTKILSALLLNLSQKY